MLTSVKNYFRSFTIEPVVVLFVVGSAIYFGAQANADLLLWKVCKIELNYTQDVCENLSLGSYHVLTCNSLSYIIHEFCCNGLHGVTWSSGIAASSCNSHILCYHVKTACNLM
jgi:hypothetical protein